MTFEPTDEQTQAIEAPERPVRVIAGAGSGKTSVMAKRIGHLVAAGRRPDEVLGLTFSNKAAENLRRRVADEVGGGIDVLVSTYHGFGASIVDEHAELLGFDRRPVLIDRAMAFQLLYGALNEVVLEKRKIGQVAHLASAALRLASQCADHLVSVEQLIRDCDRIEHDESVLEDVRTKVVARRDLARMIDVYQRVKRERGLIDFGDQIALAVRVLLLDPTRADALRDRHPVVLLDEYQDTNFAQRRLLELIYPKGSPITVVGDDLQAIYAFRGSHLRNLFEFDRHFGGEGGIVEAELTTNFRSGPEIIDLANAIHATVTAAKEKPLRPATHAAPSTIEAMVRADELDEAEQIAEWIAARGAPWSSTLVLGRKRKIFPIIADALVRRAIPVEIVGVGGLLSRPEIVDVTSWLELLALSDANLATLRLLRSPLRNVGLHDLAALAAHARDKARERDPDAQHPSVQLLDALDDVSGVPGLSMEAWSRVSTLMSDLRALRRRRDELCLADLLEEIIEVERLRDRVDAMGTENLLRFVELAHRFTPLDGEPDVASFLNWLQLVLDGEDDPAEAVAGATDAVRIMSIHQAKGLEYDNVVLAGLAGTKRSSSIFPDERMAENGVTQSEVLPLWLREDHDGFTHPPRSKPELEAFRQHANNQRADEERRLLYVAVTRAKSRLLCSTAHWYTGPTEPQGPSEFYELIARQPQVRERPRVAAAEVDPGVERRRRLADAHRQANEAAAAAAGSAGSAGSAMRPGAGKGRAARLAVGQGALLAAGAGAARIGGGAPVPAVLPVSALVTFARCPRQFAWTYVEPLPRRLRRASRLGTEVHRRLEVLAAGGPVAGTADDGEGSDAVDVVDVVDVADVVDVDGLADEVEVAGRDGTSFVEGCVTAFRSSPWGSRVATAVETPFLLEIGTTLIRGRIDARYDMEGRTEIVDFKTGRVPDSHDGGASVQLDVYGTVAVSQWGVDPALLTTSYVYVHPGGPAHAHATHWSDDRAESVRRSLDVLEAGLRSGLNEATPGPWCGGCDFTTFCPRAMREARDHHARM